MPRKLRPHVEQALQTLHARGVLAGWELDPLDGLTESQVAARMQSASVFMSTSSDEGFGLPALEAAAAGCLLVGYDGHGGREIFNPNYTWRVAQNDAHALAVALEEVLDWVDAHPDLADQRRATLSRELSVTYSEEAERRSVIEAWQTLCPDCI
jgi:glycosyltransferase involved in cell wall biosynthesis